MQTSEPPVDCPAWKRGLDLFLVLASAPITLPMVLLAWVVARVETGESGFYHQERVGAAGRRFRIVKIRTMKAGAEDDGSVTVRDDPRITRLGRVLRRLKIDELPQLWNVLRGEMTLVGPRPDVPGFADRLQDADRVVLTVKPGMTGPATLAFRDEESLLAGVTDPECFNASVLFPAKVRLNRSYVENRSFLGDVRLLVETVVPPLGRRHRREGRRLLERGSRSNVEPSPTARQRTSRRSCW